MQGNTFNKDLKMEIGVREKPLQKSVLFTDSISPQLSPTNRITPIEFTLQYPLKRSTVSSLEQTIGTSSSIIFNQSNLSFNSASHGSPQTSSFIQNTDNRPSHQQQISFQSPTHRSLLSPPKSESRHDTNPEESVRWGSKPQKQAFNYDFRPHSAQYQQLFQQITTLVKDKYIPTALGKLKKDIYDDLYNLRVELQTFREEMRSQLKKQQALILETRNHTNNSANQNNLIALNKSRKDDQVAEIQTHCFLIQGKIAQIEAKMSEQFHKMTNEVQRIGGQLNQLKPQINKSSPIKSTLPSIMLEYRQLFTVKKNPPCEKGSETEDILISSCVYYIDRSGYLMDGQNRYIIDRVGKQIRLEEKHISLLESNRILQRT